MNQVTGKDKAVPFRGLEWPRDFQELNVNRFHENGTGWWWSCQPYAAADFNPRKGCWHTILLEAHVNSMKPRECTLH